jgi:NADP-dependent 3-hydroxy acid dehydrogenase YdfG
MRNLQALITGAASGIGRALALAHTGADLYLLDIDEENLAATAREAQASGGAVKTLVCDLTQSAAISAAVSAVLAEWGALNILVNNREARARRLKSQPAPAWPNEGDGSIRSRSYRAASPRQ